MNTRQGSYCCLAVFAVASVPGCQPALMTASDAFHTPGRRSVLMVKLEHRRPGDAHGLAGVPVRYFSHNQPLGEAATDATGQAALTCELPTATAEFRAEATVAGVTLASDGRVFGHSPERTTLVCDIDETVSKTDYGALLSRAMDDAGSTPYPHAAEVLRELSTRFDLIYLTARPGSLRDKTHAWLERHGFPHAPLITAPSVREVVLVQGFKAATIARLQREVGTLTIGIGNARTDSEAYAQRGLLTLILSDRDDDRFRAHAVILRNWRQVREFFKANREVLEEPETLRAAIDGERMLQRPIIKYEKRT